MLLEQGISSSPPGANGLLYLPYLLESVLQDGMWMLERHFIGIGIFYFKGGYAAFCVGRSRL